MSLASKAPMPSRCQAKNWVKPESMRRLNDKPAALSCAIAAKGKNAAFDLQAPVLCDAAFFDTAVVKAHVHFPADWVLLCAMRLARS